MAYWIITDDDGVQIAGPFPNEEMANAESDRLISDEEAEFGANVAYVSDPCPHGLSEWLCVDPINHYPPDYPGGYRF